MGLSVVHGIVKGYGGAIKAFSRPGRFTEFHLYLPVVDVAIEAAPVIFDQQQLPGGHEHILIVDDEEMLVDMMRQVLEQLGYTVSAHADSAEALKAFHASPHTYDLLITDMTMPGMTGTSLAKAVKAIRTDIPIILCTGFNEQINRENTQSLGIETLIMKPVGMQQLAQTIREVLLPASTERRKNPRYSAPAGAFVISGTHPYERCHLLDISIAGLAYSHEMETTPGDRSDQVAIMGPGGKIFVSGIRCRTVSDIPAGRGLSLPEADQARRSVCFDGLTMPQTDLINRFIHQHALALKR
jgi:CheY-like chemotaxis protein